MRGDNVKPKIWIGDVLFWVAVAAMLVCDFITVCEIHKIFLPKP